MHGGRRQRRGYRRYGVVALATPGALPQPRALARVRPPQRWSAASGRHWPERRGPRRGRCTPAAAGWLRPHGRRCRRQERPATGNRPLVPCCVRGPGRPLPLRLQAGLLLLRRPEGHRRAGRVQQERARGACNPRVRKGRGVTSQDGPPRGGGRHLGRSRRRPARHCARLQRPPRLRSHTATAIYSGMLLRLPRRQQCRLLRLLLRLRRHAGPRAGICWPRRGAQQTATAP